MRHLVAAIDRYTDRTGTQFAGSITYFSFLALVPILMVALSVTGFVLSSRPKVLTGLRNDIAGQLPAGLFSTVGSILDTAINARNQRGDHCAQAAKPRGMDERVCQHRCWQGHAASLFPCSTDAVRT